MTASGCPARGREPDLTGLAPRRSLATERTVCVLRTTCKSKRCDRAHIYVSAGQSPVVTRGACRAGVVPARHGVADGPGSGHFDACEVLLPAPQDQPRPRDQVGRGRLELRVLHAHVVEVGAALGDRAPGLPLALA